MRGHQIEGGGTNLEHGELNKERQWERVDERRWPYLWG